MPRAQNTGRVSIEEIYKQQYSHFSKMNDLLYKLPTIYSALIGALWYFAFSSIEKDKVVATAIFMFAAVVCWYSINITDRFRVAFNKYIDRINKFDREYAVTIRPTDEEVAKGATRPLSAVRAVRRTLWAAFLFSVLGALYVPARALLSMCIPTL
jgi:hypothetical protein